MGRGREEMEGVGIRFTLFLQFFKNDLTENWMKC